MSIHNCGIFFSFPTEDADMSMNHSTETTDNTSPRKKKAKINKAHEKKKEKKLKKKGDKTFSKKIGRSVKTGKTSMNVKSKQKGNKGVRKKLVKNNKSY